MKKTIKKQRKRQSRAYNIISIIIAVTLGLGAAFTSYSQIFYYADEVITNFIYSYNPFEIADNRITIIAIDEDTIDEYGFYEDWSRSILADTINILSENQATTIGLDIDLSETKDSQGDSELVNACENAGNVIAIATADFDSNESQQESNSASTSASPDDQMMLSKPADASMNWDEHEAIKITFPFEDLFNVVTTGISNTIQQSPDGTIHSAALSVDYEEKALSSFAAQIYMAYQDAYGLEYDFPDLNNDSLFGFNTIYQTGTYQIISLCDILSGDFDSSLIQDHITIIGSLTFNDEDMNYYQYLRSDYAHQEIITEASILQTLLTNKYIEDVARLPMAILYGIVIAVFFMLLRERRKLINCISCFLVASISTALSYMLNSMGHRLLLLVPIAFVFIALMVNLTFNLIYANIEKRKMEHTLKMYVDSQVVDQITEVNPFELSSVNSRKDIAVLFVDIRGFTSMSEELEPEQVVEILNEYFSIVYSSIMAWNGTVDKFIGDAAMAIFNAPNDVEDYIFNAVCAADDIQKGFEILRIRFKEKYNKDVYLGIGINSGTAIVGNIGCLGRFDYTAIGDTVNTASRLESKAAPGQILISENVYEAIKARADASSVGALSLKGKSHAVETFQVNSIDKTEAPNKLARREFLREQNLLYTKAKRDR